MKKLFLILCVLLSAQLFWASPEFGVSFDAGVVQDYFLSKGSYQLSMDVRCNFDEHYEIRIPLTLSVKQNRYLIDSGLYAVCYPYKGLFFGVSVFEAAFESKSMKILNEITAGWKIPIKSKWFIEPSLVIRDPSGTYSDEYSQIKGVFPCYSTFRFRLRIGGSFNLEDKNE